MYLLPDLAVRVCARMEVGDELSFSAIDSFDAGRHAWMVSVHGRSNYLNHGRMDIVEVEATRRSFERQVAMK
jgi:hypothetical protein